MQTENNKVYKVVYGSIPVYYSFLFPRTRYYFRDYISEAYDRDKADITVPLAMVHAGRSHFVPGIEDSYIEYRCLISRTSIYLLRYHACIFHSASFLYKNKAWLLCAPSGTGKTTQYLNWKRLFPDEIMMICGDMPVLECKEDTSIYVHPTSWNGKEHIGNHISAPLGGIIYLEQGNQNFISRYMPKDGIIPLFGQFMVIPDTADDVNQMVKLIDSMFRFYPVMKYINLGNDESTMILRDTINQLLESKE